MSRAGAAGVPIGHGEGWLRPDWPTVPGVHTIVTTRRLPGQSAPPFDACNLGARCGDDAAAVAANRALLSKLLPLPAAPRWLRQVHGVDVHDADTPWESEPEADAAVARGAGAVLAILTADCLPILFCADDGSSIAAAHAGWRGLAAGVIEATLARMAVPAQQLSAWLGPAIAARSYEVGDEVRTAFVECDAGDASAFAATHHGHWHCDLYALARRRLIRSGVTRIVGGDSDTFTDARFYSYRRERETGRFATLIWRAADS
ncbi:MAG: peptidoglycan editing factor PgeF [Dokdonella sp.]